jgi:very-short-patch-repair endonuclease
MSTIIGIDVLFGGTHTQPRESLFPSGVFLNMIPNRDSRDLALQAWRQRTNPTPAERRLWHNLRGDQLGVRFRRQARKLGYILDFWCPSRKIAVELDGAGIDTTRARRDHHLSGWGIRVLHFPNEKPTEEIIAALRAALDQGGSLMAERNDPPKPEPAEISGDYFSEANRRKRFEAEEQRLSVKFCRPPLCFDCRRYIGKPPDQFGCTCGKGKTA